MWPEHFGGSLGAQVTAHHIIADALAAALSGKTLAQELKIDCGGRAFAELRKVPSAWGWITVRAARAPWARSEASPSK